MVEVAPIARTQVDWQALLQLAKQVLGRSISAGVDNRKQVVGDLRSYLAVLGELDIEGSDPDAVLREAGSLLRHVHYGFLVATATDLRVDVLAESDLRVSGESKCFVVSGNLEQWRTAIINGCTSRSKYVVRLFYDKCLAIFEREGLGSVWLMYEKANVADRTFRLELKK